MKVFRKKLRKLIINENLFYYVVDENSKNVIFRAYSGKYRSSFFEVTFDWEYTWYINLYKPKTAVKLIEYALDIGWRHFEEKQVIKIEEGKRLIKAQNIDIEL